jgi:hypothetical protein
VKIWPLMTRLERATAIDWMTRYHHPAREPTVLELGRELNGRPSDIARFRQRWMRGATPGKSLDTVWRAPAIEKAAAQDEPPKQQDAPHVPPSLEAMLADPPFSAPPEPQPEAPESPPAVPIQTAPPPKPGAPFIPDWLVPGKLVRTNALSAKCGVAQRSRGVVMRCVAALNSDGFVVLVRWPNNRTDSRISPSYLEPHVIAPAKPAPPAPPRPAAPPAPPAPAPKPPAPTKVKQPVGAEKRLADLRTLIGEGCTVEVIADQLAISVAAVRNLARVNGLDLPGERRPHAKPEPEQVTRRQWREMTGPVRRAEVAALRAAGRSFDWIANHFGTTRSAVAGASYYERSRELRAERRPPAEAPPPPPAAPPPEPPAPATAALPPLQPIPRFHGMVTPIAQTVVDPPKDGRGVHLFTLGPTHCRAPLWPSAQAARIETSFFCGARCETGLVYCPDHAERFYPMYRRKLA